MRRLLQVLAIVGAVLVVSGVGLAGACKLALNCHLRESEFDNEEALRPIAGQIALPKGFAAETVASQLTQPTAFDFLPDGRILVAEKDGLVRAVDDGRVARRPVLDLRDRVNSELFRGLVAIAVDPDFTSNRFVYVVYSGKRPGAEAKSPTFVLVSRFVLSEELVAGRERVILGADGPESESCTDLASSADCLPSDVDHIGADIAFGADGSLFISTGDGGEKEEVEETAFRAQDVDALGGKILRVTRDGRGIATNPFYAGDTGANRSKVWALGLRNPFRLTLAPGSGLPVVGDVGWTAEDEIDVAPAGANFGWPCFEGSARTKEYESTERCTAFYAQGVDVREPALALAHPATASVTGGVFYTGRAYPEAYRGAYFFADWALGWIRRVHVDPVTGEIDGAVSDFASNAGGPVAFRVGPEKLLYYLAVNNGELRRIVHSG